MIIAHNMMASNAYRQYNISVKNKRKSTEKLSSGYKVNRAADDAASLSISEKMRRMIRGLNQGMDNISDGISLIKTADGALSEITSILQRINELSVQAYNDTYAREDREAMQDEVEQLMTEMHEEVDKVEFNGIKLLQGDLYKSITFDEMTTSTFRQVIERTAPIGGNGWLIVSDHLSPYNGTTFSDSTLKNTYYVGASQEKDRFMFQSATGKYYGPSPAEIDVDNLPANIKAVYPDTNKIVVDVYGHDEVFEHVRNWSDGLADNPAGVIDFAGLSNGLADGNELLARLEGLLGSSIGVPCGTCNDTFYGIGFSGEVNGSTYTPLYNFVYDEKGEEGIRRVDGTQSVNVNALLDYEDSNGNRVNCFDKIADMFAHQASKADFEKLADEIAKNLASAVYDVLDSDTDAKNHFDRAYKASDTAILIYDYRDSDITDQNPNVSKISVSAKTKQVISSECLVGKTVEYREGLLVQCSAVPGDTIEIKLPEGEEIFNILNKERSYSISRYEFHDVLGKKYNTRIKEEQEEYEKKLKEYLESDEYKEYEKAMAEFEEKYKAELDKYREDMKKYEEDMEAWENDPKNYTIDHVGETHYIEHVIKPHLELREPARYDENGELQPPTYDNIPGRIEREPYTVYHDEKVFRDDGTKPKKPQMPRESEKPIQPTPPDKPKLEPQASDYEEQEEYDPDSNELVKKALSYVNKCRSRLGAMQNRLEYEYNNNSNYFENLSRAESQIRDTDMAEEVVNDAKSEILSRVAQSMLAQANQSNQSVLSLLQS